MRRQPRLAELVAGGVEGLGDTVTVERRAWRLGSIANRCARKCACGRRPSAGPVDCRNAAAACPDALSTGAGCPALTTSRCSPQQRRFRNRARSRSAPLSERLAQRAIHLANDVGGATVRVERDALDACLEARCDQTGRHAFAGHVAKRARRDRSDSVCATKKSPPTPRAGSVTAAASKPCIVGRIERGSSAPVSPMRRRARARDRCAATDARGCASACLEAGARDRFHQVVGGFERERVDGIAIERGRKHDERPRLGERSRPAPCRDICGISISRNTTSGWLSAMASTRLDGIAGLADHEHVAGFGRATAAVARARAARRRRGRRAAGCSTGDAGERRRLLDKRQARTRAMVRPSSRQQVERRVCCRSGRAGDRARCAGRSSRRCGRR